LVDTLDGGVFLVRLSPANAPNGKEFKCSESFVHPKRPACAHKDVDLSGDAAEPSTGAVLLCPVVRPV